MKIVILTNEYPPNVYGGAGVHAASLVRELAGVEHGRHHIRVLCFGDQREKAGNVEVEGVGPAAGPRHDDPRRAKLLDTLYRNTVMAGAVKEADIVHCHTWYTHLAGCLLKELLDAPLVLTSHSLEPLRPWKAEQLGSGYKVSSWLEKTAHENADGIIAVSGAMKRDIRRLYHVPGEKVRVIGNGIDPGAFRPAFDERVLEGFGIDPKAPYVLFVGRITRQKGIVHLLDAIDHLEPGVQVVLCASAPDNPAILKEVEERIARARAAEGRRIVWVKDTVPVKKLVVLYSHASLFVCPSIYEPFGIINLEAMACGTPVVASRVGGIPEIVVHGETGLLVPFEPSGAVSAEPKDPAAFSKDLAEAINSLIASPGRMKEMGEESMRRVKRHFTWKRVAQRTAEFYGEVVG